MSDLSTIDDSHMESTATIVSPEATSDDASCRSDHFKSSAARPEDATDHSEKYTYATPKGIPAPVDFHTFVNLRTTLLLPSRGKRRDVREGIEADAEWEAEDAYERFFQSLPPFRPFCGAAASAWSKGFERLFGKIPSFKPLFTTPYVSFGGDWGDSSMFGGDREADVWVISFNKKFMRLVHPKLEDWCLNFDERDLYSLYQNVLRNINRLCKYDVKKVLEYRSRRNEVLKCNDPIRREAVNGDCHEFLINGKLNKYINTCDATDRLMATYNAEKHAGKSVIVEHIAESYIEAIFDGKSILDTPRSKFPPYFEFMNECAEDVNLPKSKNPDKLMIDDDALREPSKPNKTNKTNKTNKKSKAGRSKSNDDANRAETKEDKRKRLHECLQNVLVLFDED